MHVNFMIENYKQSFAMNCFIYFLIQCVKQLYLLLKNSEISIKRLLYLKRNFFNICLYLDLR